MKYVAGLCVCLHPHVCRCFLFLCVRQMGNTRRSGLDIPVGGVVGLSAEFDRGTAAVQLTGSLGLNAGARDLIVRGEVG